MMMRKNSLSNLGLILPFIFKDKLYEYNAVIISSKHSIYKLPKRKFTILGCSKTLDNDIDMSLVLHSKNFNSKCRIKKRCFITL